MTSAKEQAYAAEFKRRRQAYLRIATPSIFLIVVAVGLHIAKLEVPRWIWLAILGAGLIGHALSRSISKYPQCPRCDTRVIPDGGWFPKRTKCQLCNLDLNF
jgi:hypothetical protein